MKPTVPNEHQRHEYLRTLWSREGALGRACWRYATMTGDTVFAVQEMVRGQLARPLPGFWQHVPLEVGEHPGLQEVIHGTLRAQREEIRRAGSRPFTMLALLQQEALRELAQVDSQGSAGFRRMMVAEARCRDLARIARLLVEQEAMREAAHELGDDHPADLTACRLLYWAAEDALESFDRCLEAGHPLAEALAAEVLIESLPSSVTER